MPSAILEKSTDPGARSLRRTCPGRILELVTTFWSRSVAWIDLSLICGEPTVFFASLGSRAE